MRVCINGEWKDFGEPLQLPDLVAHLGLPAPLLLIEHNGIALQRSEWVGRPVSDGDRLEILRVAAGG
ncbi:MAG: sulfur carrier protein ThiS [Terrimicrobiaceae bacterium]|nr:sulfur carrier protein ThiS [Terrimicrobiaceae bacterium]